MPMGATSLIMQGRNSVASINSGYEQTNQRSQPRTGPGPVGAQILSGTGDTGHDYRH